MRCCIRQCTEHSQCRALMCKTRWRSKCPTCTLRAFLSFENSRSWLVKEAWVLPASWYRRSFRSAKATVRCSSSRLLSDGSLDPAIGRATAQRPYEFRRHGDTTCPDSILLLISFVRPGVPGSAGFLAAVFCAPFLWLRFGMRLPLPSPPSFPWRKAPLHVAR